MIIKYNLKTKQNRRHFTAVTNSLCWRHFSFGKLKWKCILFYDILHILCISEYMLYVIMKCNFTFRCNLNKTKIKKTVNFLCSLLWIKCPLKFSKVQHNFEKYCIAWMLCNVWENVVCGKTRLETLNSQKKEAEPIQLLKIVLCFMIIKSDKVFFCFQNL